MEKEKKKENNILDKTDENSILDSPSKNEDIDNANKLEKTEKNKIIFEDMIKEESNKEKDIELPLNTQTKIFEQMKNNVCKINKGSSSGTGFLCIIPFPDKLNQIPVLITSNHVIGNDDVKIGNKINLIFNNNISKSIIIDFTRKVYVSNHNNFDIAIIEIKKSDELFIDNMFEIDDDIYKDFNFYQIYKNKPIYTIYYPKNKNAEYSVNKIKCIDDDNIKIKHLCSTEEGSSGAPLINIDNFKIIGVNIGKDEDCEYINIGTFIKKPINEFNKLLNYNKDNTIDTPNKDYIDKIGNDNLINDIENKIISIKINNLPKNLKLSSQSFDITENDIKRLFKKYNPIADGEEVELRQNIDFNNSLYYGEMSKNNKKHGRGILIKANGDKYEGQWQNDKANGNGKLIYSNGDIYEGEWVDDKKNGFGIYKQNNSSYYEGNWKDNLQEGKGKEKWVDGTSFEGQYKKGKRCGFGTFKWSDGSFYQGNFDDNKFNGIGEYNWSDGRKYDGEWKDNKLDGKGVYVWPDGRKYEGEYKEDKKEGYGEFEWSDGKKYKGNWKNGSQDGEGEVYFPKLTRWRRGLWEEGRRIKWLEED